MGKSIQLCRKILVLHLVPLLGIPKQDLRMLLQLDCGARDFPSRNNSSGSGIWGKLGKGEQRDVSCCCFLKQVSRKAKDMTTVMRKDFGGLMGDVLEH